MADFVKTKRHVLTDDGYKTLSQWTNAESVEMNNGTSVQTEITNLKNTATTAANGLMSSADKTKLDTVATSANNYVHPTATSHANGLYKVSVDSTGHVTSAVSVVKNDITALGIPASDTTYAAATTTKAGLMTTAMVDKLASIDAGANNYTHPSYTSYASALRKFSTDESGHVNGTAAVAKADITALGIPATDTTYAVVTSSANGLAPKLSNNAGQYLNGTGAWTVPTNTTYAAATTAADGLMTSSDKTKLDGIEAGANAYTHPTYTSATNGLYKVAVDGTGHINSATAVTKADITALGIPESDTNTTYATFTSAANGLVPAAANGSTNYATSGYVLTGAGWKAGTKYNTDNNTTYAAATTAVDGLMTSTDKTKLDGIEAGAEANIITGIKGDSETDYRTGNVNITPANIGAIASSEKGAASGIVPLNASGTIDSTYLPSYVDDVLEFASKSAFPATGESGKIYVDISAEENNTYRWSGSTYILIAKNTNTTYTLSKSGSSITLSGSDGSTNTITDSDTTYAVFTSAAAGLVPAAANGTTNYATSGYVLTGAGWKAGTKYNTDNNTTYAAATTAVDGLMTSTDKAKLDGIEAGANAYTHPTYTSAASGLRKFTVDATGHVSATAAVTKSDITALDIPAQDTTYAAFTSAANGLVPAAANGTTNYATSGYVLTGAGWKAGTKYNTDNNTTYAAATTAASGLMPALDGSTTVYLNGNGAWTTPTNTTYSTATTGADGLMTSAMVTKLNSVAASANNYTHPSYTSYASGLRKFTVDATGHVSATAAVTKADITALGIPESDTNTTYANYVGATASASGTAGLVPAATSAQRNMFLRGDATWQTPTNTTYAAVTTAANGLMIAADKIKLDSVAASANNYTHPSYTSYASALRKFTTDTSGHVSATAAVAKSDITGLGIPAQDTTYAAATTAAAGLMTTAMVTKLNGIEAGANAYTHPTYTSAASGLYKVSVDGTGHVNGATAVAKADITGLGIPESDTTYAAFTSAAAGLTPAASNGSTNYATSAYVLTGAGWKAGTKYNTDTTYAAVTTAANGLMTSADKTKLDGIATSANNYTHPTYTSAASGLRKFTVDSTGHVSATAAVAKADITALGIPESDTTYANFTSAAAGLTPAASNGSTNYATSAYVLTGAGWKAGTKYNTDTTYANYVGATSAAAGVAGLVPSATTAQRTSFLRGDGTWVVPTNTTYAAATSAAQGLTKASYVSGTTLVVF